MQQERKFDELREIKITTGFTHNALGSVLIQFGQTHVLCTAMIENNVPMFMRDTGRGWLTAEYGMLPGSTNTRKKRENYKNGPDGRSIEIQRLIGRALRQSFNLNELGERSLYVDCDVLQADGGTRTASITGGYIAMVIALRKLAGKGTIAKMPELRQVAAVSCGIVDDRATLDLCYEQDYKAQADANFVMAGNDFVEIQLTGEKRAVSQPELLELMALAQKGIGELFILQNQAIDDYFRAD